MFSQFPFDTSQVRVLVYRECDSRGRRLLFDSRALEKIYSTEENVVRKTNAFKMTDQKPKRWSGAGTCGNFVEICKEYGYRVYKCFIFRVICLSKSNNFVNSITGLIQLT